MNKETFSKVSESARKQEIEFVGKFIEGIKDDLPGTPYFLNLFAPTGFGKTVFLEQVWHQYESNLPTSFVRARDFSKEDNLALFQSKILTHITDQLNERLPKRVTPADFEGPKNEQALANFFLKFIEGAKEFEKVTLLLIDDYDLIPEEQRRWLQTNIFGPASRTRKMAVIFSSAIELRFTESFELRMNLESRELVGISPEAISAVLPEYDEIADVIHRITGGLPLLTEEFINELKAAKVVAPDDFQEHIQKFTKEYYRAYVEKQVLVDLSPYIREAMLVASLLRRFDVKIFKEVLPNLLPEHFSGYGTAGYLEIIDNMRPWVQWRRQGGYTLNPAFRLMLQEYVWNSKPDLYQRLNEAAGKMYQNWLRRGYSEQYLIEFLYHRLSLTRADKPNVNFPIPDEINQTEIGFELLEYLERPEGKSLSDVDLAELRNSLVQDTDLKHHMSEKINRRIERLIVKKRKEGHGEGNGWTTSIVLR
jgi:hypothetical protein